MKLTLFFLTIILLFASCGSEKAQKPVQNPSQEAAPKVVQEPSKNVPQEKPVNIADLRVQQDTPTGEKPSYTPAYKDDLSKIYMAYKNLNDPKKDLQKIEKDLTNLTIPTLKKAGLFMVQYVKANSKLMTDDLLTKPDLETLKALYVVKILRWNSFTSQAFDEKEAMDDVYVNTVSEDELLASYYSLLFGKIGAHFNRSVYKNIDLNLNKLKLKTAREKAIFFLTSMTAFGRKYQNEMKNSGDPIANSAAVMSDFPKINGKEYLAFQVPEFEDFNLRISAMAKNNSFKEYYLTFYNKTTEIYKKLQMMKEGRR